jgi:hypothetical protein
MSKTTVAQSLSVDIQAHSDVRKESACAQRFRQAAQRRLVATVVC